MSQMSTHVSDSASREFTPTVTVRGEAVLRAEPDEAMLWITLTALENDPGQAQAGRAYTDMTRNACRIGEGPPQAAAACGVMYPASRVVEEAAISCGGRRR